MYLSIKQVRSAWPAMSFFTPVRIFLISTMVVNGGNYLYNLSLGRYLTPAQFSEAGFIVTMLLVFSFLGMTFQIAATKYSVDLEGTYLIGFENWINKLGLYIGCFFSIIMLGFSQSISVFFNLSDSLTLPIFAMALPLYFLMSVNRGFLQGQEKYAALSVSYQVETWGRFLATVVLIACMKDQVGISVSSAIVLSVLAAFLVIVVRKKGKGQQSLLSPDLKSIVLRFFIITAAYEMAQVLINYGDLLLVKHYFDKHQAGLYTSLSLIGKMIYFIAWMAVMVLIPKVLKLKKASLPYKKLMLTYFSWVAGLTAFITFLCFLFPEFIVVNFFGAAYSEISAYLWQYALATSLFALSNIFVYYFLSIDQYIPVFMAIGIGILQVALFGFYHNSLGQIIGIQVFFMSVMLVAQLSFFYLKSSSRQ